MATSVLMASDDARESLKNFGGFEELKPENARQSGRRKSKSNEAAQKKKQPQRGMGVAKLERLRLQERWKQKMTETNPLHSLNLQSHYLLPASFPDPMSTGTMNDMGLNQALLLQSLGNAGSFCGQVGGSGVGGVFSDQFQADPYGIGCSNPILWAGNVAETSKELTSMPNMKCHSDRCLQCHKKKRVNDEENIECNGMRDKFAELSPINGCSFLGFSLGNKQNIDRENQDSGRRAPSHAGSNVDQDVEVLAVRRKGSVFMEYEFFPPGKGGRDFGSREASSVAVGGGGGDGSCVSTTTLTSTGFDASNSIDLSLKLSY